MTDGPVIALDIGGGHVTAGLVDGRALGAQARRSVDPHDSADALISTWARAAFDVCGAASPLAVGIAIPAPFDYELGISHMVHKFGALRGLAIGPMLRERWVGTALDAIPVVFGNDADLWVLGEATVAPDPAGRRLIGLTLGTGLGSGFVAEGRVVRTGDDVPTDGEIWSVPFRDGIAEDWASGRAVSEAWKRSAGGALDARRVAEAARSGDRRAQAVYTELGADLAAIVAPWVRRFNASELVVGGNVARAFDLFGPALVERLSNDLGGSIVVRPTELFEAATLLGAASLAGEVMRGGETMRGGEAVRGGPPLMEGFEG